MLSRVLSASQRQTKALLSQLCEAQLLRPLDLAFGEFIASLDANTADMDDAAHLDITMLAAYLSNRLGEQHSCLDLNTLQQPFAPIFLFSDIAQLRRALVQSAAVWVCEEGNSAVQNVSSEQSLQTQNTPPTRPMILEDNSVYLQRYWQYEKHLAQQIVGKAQQRRSLDLAAARELLNRLFVPPTSADLSDQLAPDEGIIDWQKVAVCVAAQQSISFITGGPGTGKTTTVTKLLALLQGLAKQQQRERSIALVAPTGKAAARLTSSIGAAKQHLPADLQLALPQRCQTIHRLLGAMPQSPYFKANANKLLRLDVLVVDEASMVDLPLMSKLFDALPNRAQVILLGDKDQLASVETGSVLADICAAKFVNNGSNTTQIEQNNHAFAAYSQATQQTLIALMPELAHLGSHARHVPQIAHITDNVVVLQKSHRFSHNSGIGQLAQCLNSGDVQGSMQLLRGENVTDIQWLEPQAKQLSASNAEILQRLIVRLLPVYQRYFAAVAAGDLALAFHCLSEQQVLCAQRGGAWGIDQISALIEQELNKQGYINSSQEFYAGKPLILNRNDHSLNLFNGDIGIVMADPHEPTLSKVWFQLADGQIRGFLPNRIPPSDTLYAMTIHKSQGSEFQHVHLCLPLSQGNMSPRGLSRELLYTGLTRAKQQFNLYAQQLVLQACISSPCIRGSGLAKRLR